MIFPSTLEVAIEPVVTGGDIPFAGILERFIREEFRPRACRDVLAAVVAADRALAKLVDIDAPVSGGMVIGPAALFPELHAWRLSFREGRRAAGYELAGDLSAIGELVRRGAQSHDVAGFLAFAEALGEDTLEFITRPGPAPAGSWCRAEGPGIYRRAHASLLVRSRTTSLLIDPIDRQIALPRMVDAPLDVEPPHAILITHSHDDHFHIPSILHRAAPETPVIVPRVLRPNLLSRTSFAGALEAFGQRASPLGWNQSVSIGDIEIRALPFFGEQPTRDAPGPPSGVRNHGNCYRVHTPEMSAIILVDSGADPHGDMVDVARRTLAEHGPVDAVLACLRSFASPFFGGLPYYWAALPFARLAELWARYRAGTLPATTAGVEGTAAFCAASGARFFLPYAHGFEGPGASISDVSWGAGEPAEAVLMASVQAELLRVGAPTRTLSWNPGDVARPSHGTMRIERPPAR